MANFAEFKSRRSSNALLGLGLLLIPVSTFYIAFFGSEGQLLGTRGRRGSGFLKLIEQTIGWDMFVVLMIVFGLWGIVYSIVLLWKAIDSTADVKALYEGLEFHPAVKNSPTSYDEVSHWSIEMVSGHPVVWIHLNESYWSLQGLFKRKTIKLEGDREQLMPLVDYFSHHPAMMNKLVAQS